MAKKTSSRRKAAPKRPQPLKLSTPMLQRCARMASEKAAMGGSAPAVEMWPADFGGAYKAKCSNGWEFLFEPPHWHASIVKRGE